MKSYYCPAADATVKAENKLQAITNLQAQYPEVEIEDVIAIPTKLLLDWRAVGARNLRRWARMVRREAK